MREQGSLLPACVGDYVGLDHLARGIEAYVAPLDPAAPGFGHTDHVAGGPGQPEFDSADLLKLYLYG